uniref:NADH-ubiquinone oxidoreductase chain 1 n=1 Tax=Labyrinthula sp. TaxID=1678526 RepID=A0A7S6ZP74_9STRA|nr:NADH dehydrogenase subunit 1 [Labyrinthula sp.]
MLVVKVLGIVVGLLLGIAYMTVVERKYLSSIQRRRGPNVVGFYGLLQAIADGLKLLLKETIIPGSANKGIYLLAPVITFTLGIASWGVMPIGKGVVYGEINIGLMYILAVSSLGVYGVIMAGWASNSKYAFLGAMRSTAQMVSYEVSIGFTLVTVMLCGGTLNLTGIVESQEGMWYMIPLFPIYLVFMVSILAETNRHPFDLPEAESELVSGYNVEYSAMTFALFFLGETANIILMSGVSVLLFMGGWMLPYHGSLMEWTGGWVGVLEPLVFGIKTFMVMSFFVWARAAYPRYRYDQLMRLGWKVFLPVTMGWVVMSSGLMIGMDWLP